VGRAARAFGDRGGMIEASTENPILVEVARADIVESRHRGAIAVADAGGNLLFSLGDVARPIFPRSAIKVLQAIPLVESGAADALGLGDAELAVACASHSGDKVHLESVRAIIAKVGLDEDMLACGAHWPLGERASRDLMLAGMRPQPIHNNCSGKHAGMLAACLQSGLDPIGYERHDHPLQQAIKRIVAEVCGADLGSAEMGIDGCSVPTFALPLQSLATGFARIGSGKGLPRERTEAVRRLTRACFAKPVLMAGEGRFDTLVLGGLVNKAFSKGGAEGVHVAALPELEIGIALKIDDGAKRGTELVMAHLLAQLLPGADRVLAAYLKGDISTWRGRTVGSLRPSKTMTAALDRLAESVTPVAARPQRATLA
jgi:L-asparaginase II